MTEPMASCLFEVLLDPGKPADAYEHATERTVAALVRRGLVHRKGDTLWPTVPATRLLAGFLARAGTELRQMGHVRAGEVLEGMAHAE